jgi:hypothetical protein
MRTLPTAFPLGYVILAYAGPDWNELGSDASVRRWELAARREDLCFDQLLMQSTKDFDEVGPDDRLGEIDHWLF